MYCLISSNPIFRCNLDCFVPVLRSPTLGHGESYPAHITYEVNELKMHSFPKLKALRKGIEKIVTFGGISKNISVFI